MAAIGTQLPTAGQLLVGVSDLSMMNDIKKAISMLKGVTTVKKAASKREQSQARLSTAKRKQARPGVKQKTRPRLYDPETGEYLNDKTMQVIEDVRSGKDQGTTYESFDEFKKAMMAL